MDGNSDSQASQILANLQDRREASKHSTASESLNSHATCTDSSLPKNIRSSARYHFHGLAATQTTQTETQLNSHKDDQVEQESQKENIHSPVPSADQRALNPAVAARHLSKGSRSPVPSNATKNKGKAMSFQSPACTNNIPHTDSATSSPLSTPELVDHLESSDSNPAMDIGTILVEATQEPESQPSQVEEEEESQTYFPDPQDDGLYGAQPPEDFDMDVEDSHPPSQQPDEPSLGRDSPSQMTDVSSQDAQAFWDDQNNIPRPQYVETQIEETQPVETQVEPAETQMATQLETQPDDEPQQIDVPDACWRAYQIAKGSKNPMMDVSRTKRWSYMRKDYETDVPDEVWVRYWKERKVNPMDTPTGRRWPYLLKDFERVASEEDQTNPLALQLHDHLDTPVNPPTDEVLSQALQETQLADESDQAYAVRPNLVPPRTRGAFTRSGSLEATAEDAMDIAPDFLPTRASSIQATSTRFNANDQSIVDNEDCCPDSEPARGGVALPATSTASKDHGSSRKRRRSDDEDEVSDPTKLHDESVPDSTEAEPDPNQNIVDSDEDEDEESIPLYEQFVASEQQTRNKTGSMEQMPPPRETRSTRSKGKQRADSTPTAPSARKRQRTVGASIEATPMRTRLSSKPPVTPNDNTPGPSTSTSKTRSNSKKREASVASSSGSSTKAPLRLHGPDYRVFALWKQDAHYYAGVVTEIENSGYTVAFCDNTERKDIAIEHMRIFDLRRGDSVVYGEHNHVGTVSRVGEDDIHIIAGVNPRPQLLHYKDIKVSSKTVESQWTNRMLTEQMIKTIGEQESRQFLYVGKSVDINTLDHFLRGCAIVPSFSSTDPTEREQVIDGLRGVLETQSGKLLSDWHDVIHLKGKKCTQHWYIESKDVRWKGLEDIRRLYLVGDDTSQKAKFLFAIAIGVPCLSKEWLEDEAQIHEWNRYLLTQGYSDHLHARISQSVDLDWGNSVSHLEEIMDNPVPPKLFAGKFVSLTKSVGIPHIILGMGARRVEYAKTWENASREKGSCDYIVFVKQRPNIARMPRDCRLVSWNWVKQCLITGRMIPGEG
ncbi:hypothetical protein D9758_000621 [Tetrapyrgos nigripes]|uniref:DNA repair protein Crb2 Tudor domain-containing protein n=1 Tax=Tetrapyrgos nigripes TaxID=182062 RepID=A0A8H5GZG5_9AGAR|nr:hypothetical protein D9758_000621 [Tetrapyrgos nigripes]